MQIFQALENPHEVDTLETYQALLVAKRKVFLNSIMNQTSDLLPATLDTMLAEYEAVVEVISTVFTLKSNIYISTLYIYISMSGGGRQRHQHCESGVQRQLGLQPGHLFRHHHPHHHRIR